MNFIFRKDKSKSEELTLNAFRVKELCEELQLKDHNKFIQAIVYSSLSLHESMITHNEDSEEYKELEAKLRNNLNEIK